VTPRRLRLDVVAWLAALLPLAASHFAYLISAFQELVPWCVPHLEGCTSVSRAARVGAANVLFKSLMLPFCAVVMTFWWLAAQWLRELQPDRRRTRLALVVLGVGAALATAMYTAALGVDGGFYQLMRRYGTNIGFGCTVLAELLLANALASETRVPSSLRRAMVGTCMAMLLLGLASIPLQFFTSSRSEALNAIEWIYGVLMVCFFPLAGTAARYPSPQ
jgi:hypothetical protein